MSLKAKNILYNLLDFGLTFGGSAGVIVYNYISPDNSTGFKIGFTGVVLIVALLLTAKSIFEKRYQNKMNTYLEQLASSTEEVVKQAIKEKIKSHKLKNSIYQRIMMLLPFMILYTVTWLGQTALASLQGTVGLILLSMGIGSIFNVIKKPVAENYQLQKIERKARKKEK